MRQMITRGPIALLGRPDKKRLAVSIGDSTTVNGMNGLVIPAGETADMWFITPPVKIPAATLASVRPRLTCTLSGSGVATIKHGRYFSRVLPNNLEQ